MADIEMSKLDASESDNLYDLVQAKKKLPSLSWKQRVIGFLITAGLSATFAILVSASSITQAFLILLYCFVSDVMTSNMCRCTLVPS